MKRILLVCNAGMSTSLLVQKMQASAKERGIDVEIEAKSVTEAKKDLSSVNVVLVGPQIRYELNNIKVISGGVSVDAINMLDYGMMNGENVLKQALDLMGEQV